MTAKKKTSLKRNNGNGTEKQSKVCLIPLFCIIPVALMCIIMIYGGLHFEAVQETLPFIEKGGVFKYNDIEIFGISIYIILLLVGFLVALLVSALRRNQMEFSVWKSLLLVILFGLLAPVLGSKVLAGVEEVITSGDFAEFTFSEFSMFGGLYFSIIVIPLFAWIFKRDMLELADWLTPACIIMLLFTRIGCFIVGCCGSRWFPTNSGYIRLPVQLFEVAGDLLLLSFSLWMEKKNLWRKGKRYGTFPIAIGGYCLMRFFLEYVRAKEYMSSGLTLSQIHCIIFIIIVIFMIVFSKKLSKK